MPESLLSGWGRTSPSAAVVVPVASAADVEETLASAGPRGVLARGLGRSYGDAAQNAGGTVLDLSALRSIEVRADGTVAAGAGATMGALIDALAPHGLFVPVSPGTSRITLGGAVAADVHGKNHHRDGSFGDHVLELEIVTPADGLRRVSRSGPPEDVELLLATLGGMGLTGIVTGVVLRAMAVSSPAVLVDTRRLDGLEAVMDRMASTDDQYRYSVAWVDVSARGSRMGRGIVTQADHAPARTDLAPGTASAARVAVPVVPPFGLINRPSVAAFNEAWFRRAPRSRDAEPQGVRRFFHPLDGVDGWNRVYGPGGLVQHQCALPTRDDVVRVMTLINQAGIPSFLTVLKRFGPGSASPLSFPAPGWTLAVDLPAGAGGLAHVLDRVDEAVLAAGGRIYLAKDGRTSPESLRRMYPRLDDFLSVRARADPRGVLVSDLSRRLDL